MLPPLLEGCVREQKCYFSSLGDGKLHADQPTNQGQILLFSWNIIMASSIRSMGTSAVCMQVRTGGYILFKPTMED